MPRYHGSRFLASTLIPFTTGESAVTAPMTIVGFALAALAASNAAPSSLRLLIHLSFPWDVSKTCRGYDLVQTSSHDGRKLRILASTSREGNTWHWRSPANSPQNVLAALNKLFIDCGRARMPSRTLASSSSPPRFRNGFGRPV